MPYADKAMKLAYAAEWDRKNPGKANKRKREWARRNRDKVYRYQHAWRVKHGLSRD